MKVCLLCPGSEYGREVDAAVASLARLLAREHDVLVVHTGGRCQGDAPIDAAVGEVLAVPDDLLVRSVFAGPAHRASAAAMEALEEAYGEAGPDYVEAPDYGAAALVPLMARRCGRPLLQDTLIAVRLHGSGELVRLHDGTFGDRDSKLLAVLEREQLRLADRVLWPGGDALDLYRRYYQGLELPSTERISLPAIEDGLVPAAPEPGHGPLRILFEGPLERRAGVLTLAEALRGLPDHDWQLTVRGEDTMTAPGGQSVWMTLEAMFGQDPRVRLLEPEEDGPARAEHDLAAVVPRFAIWPAAALAAMAAGLPVLATPVGGLTELVEPGVTGWLTTATGPEAIRDTLRFLLEHPEQAAAVRRSGRPAERLRGLDDPEALATAYSTLLDSAPVRSRVGGGGRAEPSVTAVVPFYRLSAYVEEAVDSLLGQTHRNLDVVIVDDGSFAPGDEVLERLAENPRVTLVTQLNAGENVAGNIGALLARGEYLAFLDADNVLEPDFVARAVALLEREPEIDYAGCWLRFIDAAGSPAKQGFAGYAALGNSLMAEEENNWDGDAIAVMRRRLFSELGFRFEPENLIHHDWEFFRQLRKGGRFGIVIPEWLARYRVLSTSLLRAHGERLRAYGWEEGRSRRILQGHRWTGEQRR